MSDKPARNYSPSAVVTILICTAAVGAIGATAAVTRLQSHPSQTPRYVIQPAGDGAQSASTPATTATALPSTASPTQTAPVTSASPRTVHRAATVVQPADAQPVDTTSAAPAPTDSTGDTLQGAPGTTGADGVLRPPVPTIAPQPSPIRTK